MSHVNPGSQAEQKGLKVSEVTKIYTVKSILFMGAIVRGLSTFFWFVGNYFVGNWFNALQCQTIHYLVKGLWGRKCMGRGNP